MNDALAVYAARRGVPKAAGKTGKAAARGPHQTTLSIPWFSVKRYRENHFFDKR
jgi:hypothetical protein